jgi:TrmH family RNA methyltransferase
MGAILHVNVIYTDLRSFLNTAIKNNIKVFGALIDGKSIYSYKLDNKGIILLGNESKGISEELIPYVTDRIMIPKISVAQSGIDSLNVSMAASVIFSEFTRSRGRQG